MRLLILLSVFSCIFAACENTGSGNIQGVNHDTGNGRTYLEPLTVQYKNIQGVRENLLSLDIYRFEHPEVLHPVVIYVHGGAWVTGDKANKLENKKSLFSESGYVLVSINYRLSPADYSPDPGRVRYPVHNQDAADAVIWVYENIHDYGGDKNRIALLGHSAGAHLVALTATSSLFLPSAGVPLNAIKGAACIDTEGYDVAEQAGNGELIYINAFGSDPDIWEEASPVSNIFSGTAYPSFFIAKRGSVARIATANRFINKLQINGVSVSQVNGSVYDHEGINDAIGSPGEKIITEPLKAFLNSCFK